MPASMQHQMLVSTSHLQVPTFLQQQSLIPMQPQLPVSTQHLVPAHMQHQCSSSILNQGSAPETPQTDYYRAQDTYTEIPQVTDYANSQIPVFSPQGMVRHKFQDTNNNLQKCHLLLQHNPSNF